MTTDREALAELVALKDLKAQVEALSYGGFQGKVTSSGGMEWEDRHAECEKLKAEYVRRKPLAWAAARARLALPEAVPSVDDALRSVITALPGMATYVHDRLLEIGTNAARYEWLRDASNWREDGPTPMVTTCESTLYGDALDKAIDAAIDEQINAPAGTPALPGEGQPASNALGHETERAGKAVQRPVR